MGSSSRMSETCGLDGHRPHLQDVDLERQLEILRLLDQVPMPPEARREKLSQYLESGVITNAAIMESQRSTQPARIDGSQMCPRSRYEEDFERVELLGRGGFGEVWRCRHKIDKQDYAVKAVNFPTNGKDVERQKEMVEREAKIWARVSHPNIVRYHSTWTEQRCEGLRTMSELGSHMLASPASPLASDNKVDSNTESSCLYDNDISDGEVVFEDSAEGQSSEELEASDRVKPNRGQAEVGSVTSTALTSPSLSVQRTLYIQTELCSKDTLLSWIERRNKAANSKATKDQGTYLKEALDIFQQCVSAVAHLHTLRIVHRDLKPANIFRGFDGRIRLGDFGLAKLLGNSNEEDEAFLASPKASADDEHSRGVGTPSYASPEQMANNNGPRPRYGLPTDIHALGIILAELLVPVGSDHERAKLHEDLRGGRGLPEDVTARFPCTVALLVAMTSQDPAERPTAQELLLGISNVSQEVMEFAGKNKNVDSPKAEASVPKVEVNSSMPTGVKSNEEKTALVNRNRSFRTSGSKNFGEADAQSNEFLPEEDAEQVDSPQEMMPETQDAA